MSSSRDPLVAVLDMIEAGERAQRAVRDLDRPSFVANEMIRYAVWAQIVILGEAVRRIPETWQLRHPGVPWRMIAGMRNRLVHGYDVIDWDIVWDVATKELDPVLSNLRALAPKAH